MEETIRTLVDTLDQLRAQRGEEFFNHKRAANQASMACNITREIQSELKRLEEECDLFDRWKEYTKVKV